MCKIDLKNKTITEIDKLEASQIVLDNLETRACKIKDSFTENRVALRETEKNLQISRANLDFDIEVQKIENIERPLEEFEQSNQILDLSYEKINEYIQIQSRTELDSREVVNRKLVYKPYITPQEQEQINFY